jgi:hypothetical protein
VTLERRIDDARDQDACLNDGQYASNAMPSQIKRCLIFCDFFALSPGSGWL